MKKFEVSYEDNKRITFLLDIGKGVEICFDISIDLSNVQWEYLAGKSVWSYFSLRNGNFGISNLGIGETITLQEFTLINEGFHELFHQIKNDPSYRLKILQLLNDENREIWNNV